MRSPSEASLVTARSETDAVPPSNQPDDFDEQLQRMMADAMGAADVPTGVMLEAIEAQIDTVLMTLDQSPAEGDRTAVDDMIVRRFRAKHQAVEDTLPHRRCSAAGALRFDDDDDDGAGSGRMSMSAPRQSLFMESVIAALCYFLAPCLALLLLLFAYSRADMRVCGFECPCSLAETSKFGFSFFLLMQLPRCFVFAFLANDITEGMVTERAPPASCFRQIVKWNPGVWGLACGALLVAIVVETLVSGFDMPRYLTVPVRAFAFGLPFFTYCALRRALPAAAPVLWLQFLPLAYELLVPRYLEAPIAMVAVWPLVVAVVDRIFFYCLVLMLPATCSEHVKVMAAHVAAYYSQAIVAAMPLGIDMDANPAIVVVYFVLVAGTEFLLSAHWLDRLLLFIANKIHAAARGDEPYVFGAADIRLTTAYTRHVSGVLVILAFIPVLAIKRLPLALQLTDCHGHPHSTQKWWAAYVVVAAAVLLACMVTAVRRVMEGAMVRPVTISCPLWSIGIATYLVMLTPEAFSYLP